MKLALPFLGYAAAGGGSDALPAERCVPMQPAGSTRGGGRLPRLALELAQRALGGRTPASETGVLLGTALGCLSETESFVSHMLRAQEATPKPRAFSSSVHNAIASFVALKLGAQGECTTFVHGELSFAHALLAAALSHERSTAPLLVGAVDEAPGATFLELARAAGRGESGEGGALFLVAGPSSERGATCAWLDGLAFARPLQPLTWAQAELAPAPPEVLLFCPAAAGQPARRGAASQPALVTTVAEHPSSLATATALALALLGGEVAPELLDFPARPRRVAVLATSVHGEAALLSLRRS